MSFRLAAHVRIIAWDDRGDMPSRSSVLMARSENELTHSYKDTRISRSSRRTFASVCVLSDYLGRKQHLRKTSPMPLLLRCHHSHSSDMTLCSTCRRSHKYSSYDLSSDAKRVEERTLQVFVPREWINEAKNCRQHVAPTRHPRLAR